MTHDTSCPAITGHNAGSWILGELYVTAACDISIHLHMLHIGAVVESVDYKKHILSDMQLTTKFLQFDYATHKLLVLMY